MYRPKDWKPLQTESGYFWMPDGNHIPMGAANALYEAGADAMLEAIWELAKKSPTGNFTFASGVQSYRSRVFIPDDTTEYPAQDIPFIAAALLKGLSH